VGLILDSSVVIAAERRRDTVEKLIEHVISVTGDQEAALSSVGLTELAHGIYRAQTPETRLRRQSFIDALLRVLTVYPYTKETALLGAKIDGEQQAQGVTIPFGDLLVGVTALELGFPVLTINVRHFRLIPGLQIVQLSETVSGPVVASNKMDKVRK
jgi:predicted nucleic acid-binding protein